MYVVLQNVQNCHPINWPLDLKIVCLLEFSFLHLLTSIVQRVETWSFRVRCSKAIILDFLSLTSIVATPKLRMQPLPP